MATNRTSGSSSIRLRTYVPRGPIPIAPRTILSFGGTEPFLPRALDGTKAGTASAKLDRARNSRRVIDRLAISSNLLCRMYFIKNPGIRLLPYSTIQTHLPAKITPSASICKVIRYHYYLITFEFEACHSREVRA
jgi:hypothetical protein